MEDNFETIDAEFKDEDKDGVIVFQHSMFKLSHFIAAIKLAFQSKGLDELAVLLNNRGGVPVWKDNKPLWFSQGIKSEILRLNGQGWQKGKIRIKVTLEFCPDESESKETLTTSTEPDSPLDDLRRMINEEAS
ncbi:hypothetical protein NIES2111_21280 [Nostoc sp. NIES-2111]|nr:hypothetical protein NIES2111_21280 [Nostoc sp. NIES-2111]